MFDFLTNNYAFLSHEVDSPFHQSEFLITFWIISEQQILNYDWPRNSFVIKPCFSLDLPLTGRNGLQ